MNRVNNHQLNTTTKMMKVQKKKLEKKKRCAGIDVVVDLAELVVV